MDDNAPQTVTEPRPMARSAWAWWREGLRSAVFLRPDWTGLRVTPLIVVGLALVPYLAGLTVERLLIDGPASFDWRSIYDGWLDTLLALLCCWLLAGPWRADKAADAPDTAGLFAMVQAQLLPVIALMNLVALPLWHGGADHPPSTYWQAAWWAMLGWGAIAQLVLLLRSTNAGTRSRVLVTLLIAGGLGMQQWIYPAQHWFATAPPAGDLDLPQPLKLTQEELELQPQLLQAKLQALAAGRDGVVDMYAITYAPFAEEDVFKNESALVASVMEERFGTEGKTLQLVNHRDTIGEWPWATPANLQRSIERVAQVMNRDEDVLFIHLTSHGARDGELATEFSPLDIDPVTPALLRQWLDDAGIRYRVISISACFSGSWIEPLAEPGTLVMTAADADHTSYGCGSKSPLTFFGRAMYDEELRHTWSFEKAQAAARKVIDQREREAGKTDGYSNPQIKVGEAIRVKLSRMEEELAKR